MIISTKGRYALRVMIDLAKHSNGEFLPLKDIAARQEISEKYLEAIIKMLVSEKMVVGLRGKGGGYKLSRAAEDYTVWDIVSVTENSLAPVTCLEPDAANCPRAAVCETLPMWKEFNQTVMDFFKSYTVADLINNGDDANNYII